MCFAFKHKDSHILLLLEDVHRIQSRFRDLEGLARRIFTCVVPEFVVAFSNTSNPRIAQPSMQDLIPHSPSSSVSIIKAMLFLAPKLCKFSFQTKKPTDFRFVIKPFQFSSNLKT